MAINVSFNGATIFKPGAYSRTTIDLGGGFPVGPAGLIAVIGEADAGAPGAQEVNIADNRFSGDQLVTIRDKYRSGSIVDAASFLFAPASDAAIPSGAQTVWLYKTNNSTRATLALANSYGTVRSSEWGVGGNRITYKSVLIAETAPSIIGTSFDEQALAGTESFALAINGGALNIFTLSGIPIDNADLAAQLANGANWSAGLPVGASVVVGGADNASTISISLSANATQHQLGYGRSLEVAGANPSAFNLIADLYGAGVEPSATITLEQKRDLLSEEEALGGNIVLEIGNNGANANVSASVNITDSEIQLKENALVVHSFQKSSFRTISELASEINLATYAGWSAQVSDALYNQLSLSVLDHVSDIGALSAAGELPARIKKDSYDVEQFFADSSLASIISQSEVGLPDAQSEISLANGAKGSTSTADIIAALEKFEKFHVNFIVPLFSRDAADDIADGLTESASTYTIAGIHQAVKTHISLMKTTKKRSERQGMLSYRAPFIDCKTKAGELADGRIQLVIQDIRQVDAQGSVKWFQPWALSAILAGARSGAPIGEPMTFKFMNLSGIRHTAQSLATADEDIVIDFDPDLQTDEAIQAGITFLEAPQTGGFRVVVDNTTYGVDNNFVFNRANVLYAADIVAFNFRNAMEARFVGRKNTINIADVTGFASSVLSTFLSQGIIVSTGDAPQGFKNLVARINGNVIEIEVTIKIVEGIDFVLTDINIQRATQG
jgi:hypothetical protein